MTITAKQIAVVHVARRALRLADDDYRAILRRYGGANSSKDLESYGFSQVMRRFRELGFESDFGKANMGDRENMASPKQVAYIRDLWRRYTDGAGTDASLGKWLDGRFKVSALRFVNHIVARKAIAALRAMVDRKAGQRRRA